MFIWLGVLVLVLVLGQSSRHRDDRSTISKRQPKHVHRQQRWVVGPVNSCDAPVVFIDTVRAPKLDIRQSQPKGKKKRNFRYMREAPTTSRLKCERSWCSHWHCQLASVSTKTRMRRSANGRSTGDISNGR